MTPTDVSKDQLDSTVLEIFDVLEALYDAQNSLQQVMKDGFFNLSRARYNLGVKRVSADQIVEADMQAIHTVLVSGETSDLDKDDHDDEDTVDVVASKRSNNVSAVLEKKEKFTLHTLAGSHTNKEEFSPQKLDGNNSVTDHLSALRKRNINTQISSDKNEELESGEDKSIDTPEGAKDKDKYSSGLVEDEIENDKKTGKSARPFNPLHLFGVLVPRELKTSQQKFETAVQLSVEISNLKHRLDLLQDLYVDMRRRWTCKQSDE